MPTRVLLERCHPVWAGLSYAVLTLALTYPLVGRLASALPSDPVYYWSVAELRVVASR